MSQQLGFHRSETVIFLVMRPDTNASETLIITFSIHYIQEDHNQNITVTF
jgi:hypothetical protein